LHILKWARNNGCDWDSNTCKAAGHLHILQWARENGCDWDSNTTRKAAENGHFHILQWAHQNGCEWDWKTCFAILFLYNGIDDRREMLLWCIMHGCPTSGTNDDAHESYPDDFNLLENIKEVIDNRVSDSSETSNSIDNINDETA